MNTKYKFRWLFILDFLAWTMIFMAFFAYFIKAKLSFDVQESEKQYRQFRLSTEREYKIQSYKPEVAIEIVKNSIIKIPAGQVKLRCYPKVDCTDSDLAADIQRVDAFNMMNQEVTNNLWQSCVADNACPPSGASYKESGTQPVHLISYEHIVNNFIPWLERYSGRKFRLPTRNEWVYAALAGSNGIYSWGDSINEERQQCRGCYTSNDFGTYPVSLYSPNAFGLYDMHGNVAEFVTGCAGSYEEFIFYKPKKNKGCMFRQAMGGAWDSSPESLNAYESVLVGTDRLSFYVGFRLVMD